MSEENIKSGDASDQEPVLRDHTYDGIQEYDNPMPGWWLAIFWATVIFTPIYILGVHVFGFIPSYQDDLADSQAELAEIRQASQAMQPAEITPELMSEYIDNPDAIQAGSETFVSNCVMCHGDKAQGLIGPNLTDEYWIHGGSAADLFKTITNGVPEKGMTPWGNILSQEQRLQVIAYIRSIAGTNPPGGKGPQGELYAPADSTG
jgi:cytochrome c oxidase cbb3-type subunit 3